jgi:hypothetical protein
MVTSWTMIEFLHIVYRFFNFFLFIVLFKKSSSRTNKKVDRKPENGSKKKDDENRDNLNENIGCTIRYILNNPDDESSPDDEKIPKH